MDKKEIIDLLKSYVNLLNSEGISVNKAFLYGSYLNDTASDSSDIDVLIVSDKYDESDDIAAGKAWMLTRNVSTQIEPFFIGLKRFSEERSSPFIHMIKNDGIEIT